MLVMRAPGTCSRERIPPRNSHFRNLIDADRSRYVRDEGRSGGNGAARDQPGRGCDYALELVGPAPQPPHERAWRHPSELAPSNVDIEETAGGGRALVLATGVAAAMLAVVMVVALTPPRSDAPVAVSATTLPAMTSQLRGSAVQSSDQNQTARDSEQVRIGSNTMSRDNALTLVGAPNAVSAASANPSADVGKRLPGDDERVYVLTRSHTYALWWSQVDRLVAPDGAIVVTADGELVAAFVDGELDVLVD